MFNAVVLILMPVICFCDNTTISDLGDMVTITNQEKIQTVKIAAEDIIHGLINETYDRRVRPPNWDKNGINQPVLVTVNLYVRSMSNIDFVKMEYSIQLTFRQSWKDPRLAYQHRGARVPKYIIITRNDLIWIPDTFFMNEKQAHRHMIDTPNMLFRIHPDGTVLYSERISLSLSCPMYLQKYPMDKQQCRMDFASYAYTTEDIVYQWKIDDPVQMHVLLNGSLPCFTLDSINIDYCTSKTNTGVYSCLSTLFHLHRQFSYYLVQVYIPSTLLVIVSWVSFWLDRTAVPARVTLGVTTLLTMTTQAGSINAGLPAVSYVKSIDIWIGVCLLFIFSAVLEFAWVSLVASSAEIRLKRRQACDQHMTKSPQTEESLIELKEWKRDDEDELLSARTNNSEAMKPKMSWWQKWTYGADESKMVDLRSRIIFPLSFVGFQFIYWTWYSYL